MPPVLDLFTERRRPDHPQPQLGGAQPVALARVVAEAQQQRGGVGAVVGDQVRAVPVGRGVQELADAEQKLDDARRKLADGQQKYADGEERLAESRRVAERRLGAVQQKLEASDAEQAEQLAVVQDNRALLSWMASCSDTRHELVAEQLEGLVLSQPEPEYRRQVLARLVDRDVVTKRAERYYKIKIDLMRRWLLREKGEEFI